MPFLTSQGAQYLLETQRSEGKKSSYQLRMVATTRRHRVNDGRQTSLMGAGKDEGGQKKRVWACNDSLFFLLPLSHTLTCKET